tara:strand:+ start:22205 stop:22477 length:273 start_codon:yes stop_codon:yes gene_type:complete
MQCNLTFLKLVLFVYFNSSISDNNYIRDIYCYLAHEYFKINQHNISKFLGCNKSKVKFYKGNITSLLRANDKVLLNDLLEIKKLLNNGKR